MQHMSMDLRIGVRPPCWFTICHQQALGQYALRGAAASSPPLSLLRFPSCPT